MARFDRFKGFLTLGKDVNKVSGNKELQEAEGVISPLTEQLTLQTKDEDLITQKKQWIQAWSEDQQKLSERQRESERYWLGRVDHAFFDTAHDFTGVGAGRSTDQGLYFPHPLTDNLIFESLETFLPQATRRNPEPIVRSDDSIEGKELSDNVRKLLIYLADILQMRLKIKSVTRNWALYFVGIGKVGWDLEEEEITLTPIRPQKMIFQPDATITEKGKYTGEYLGEWKQDTAANLVLKFPDKKEDIKEIVSGKMGTKVQYIEWWADFGKILFWTLGDIVLDKTLNPHWNYPSTESQTDEFGVEEEVEMEGNNHFKSPQFPYAFLSMYNLGMTPYDSTSLIEQNLGNQDLIVRRYRQIDRNVSDVNGGWAISGELSGISKEQAAGAIEAFRDGRGVWIPQGSVQNAVQRIQGSGLPADVFNQLVDARQQLRNIFGVSGSVPESTKQEDTVRGKIIIGQQDQSRIGGGIAEYIEQWSDYVYNQFVQFMMVYYDVPHMASVIGKGNAFETVQISREDFNRQLLVSVKEGSMIPKDPLTQANQAIDLYSAGAISPVTLHERLDDPNPQETVKELVEFQTNPQSILGGPEQQAIPQQQFGVPGQEAAIPQQQTQLPVQTQLPPI